MEVIVNPLGYIQLEKVFVPITLATSAGEKLIICMRDSGFEFIYDNKAYSAKAGEVSEMFRQTIEPETVIKRLAQSLEEFHQESMVAITHKDEFPTYDTLSANKTL